MFWQRPFCHGLVHFQDLQISLSSLPCSSRLLVSSEVLIIVGNIPGMPSLDLGLRCFLLFLLLLWSYCYCVRSAKQRVQSWKEVGGGRGAASPPDHHSSCVILLLLLLLLLLGDDADADDGGGDDGDVAVAFAIGILAHAFMITCPL